jgi:phage terminase small subunit
LPLAALKNAKRETFALEYVKDHNAIQAYIRAGYSPKGAGQAAHKLLKIAEVAARIAELDAKLADEALISAKEIILELKRIGFSDPGQILDERGNCRTLNEMPEDIRRCIASVKFSGDGGTEVKFWPKNHALELLGKYRELKMWTDKVELTGKDGGQFTVKVVSYEGDE